MGGEGEKDLEADWVFDSLVGFLRGPVWNVPILTFIEEKSIIFQPEGGPEEEYKKVHEQYRNLVDYMLGSFMEDLVITPEQFESACQKASQPVTLQVHQGLFEQVWAADDAVMFQRLMAQKNIELQLQALDILQQRYGITPSAFLPPSDDDLNTGSNTEGLTEQEGRVMEEVLRRSLAEQSAADTDLERALAESTEMERIRLETDSKKGKQKMDEVLRASLTSSQNRPTEEIEHRPPSGKLKSKVVTPDEMPSSDSVTKISPEELQKRQEYLREQRDKLVALKKQARKEVLEGNNQGRPKSARAAQSALGSTGAEDHSSIDPKTLQARRALAQRLKAEVVGQIESN